jgi:Bacterial Type VI secretion, VC_A0110, EvfL, ImpJ, VasE
MSTFPLYSIDWRSVSLLHGEHLKSETAYLEQLIRWGMQYGHASGVVRMDVNALTVHGSDTAFEVQLHHCQAITPNGFIIDTDEEEAPITLMGENSEHIGMYVMVYLGVSRQKEPTRMPPVSQSFPLLECTSLRWQYILRTERESAQYDWIVVGRLKKNGTRFERDSDFIPPCVSLKAHAALIAMTQNIAQTAEATLTRTEETIRRHPELQLLPWRTQVAMMAHPLAEAATVGDWEATPKHYLERLLVTVRTLALMINLVDKTDSRWTDAYERIQKALQIQQALRVGQEADLPDAFWSDSFEKVKRVFEVWGELLKGMSPVGVEPSAASPIRNTGSVVDFKRKE